MKIDDLRFTRREYVGAGRGCAPAPTKRFLKNTSKKQVIQTPQPSKIISNKNSQYLQNQVFESETYKPRKSKEIESED